MKLLCHPIKVAVIGHSIKVAVKRCCDYFGNTRAFVARVTTCNFAHVKSIIEIIMNRGIVGEIRSDIREKFKLADRWLIYMQKPRKRYFERFAPISRS